MSTANPYIDGTDEYHAWHEGYEGRMYMHPDAGLGLIYDAGRAAAVGDCLKGVGTEIVRELQGGHVYFILQVNGTEVFKSMLSPVVEKLKDNLDRALRLP